MLKRIPAYFIPADKVSLPEIYRKYNLIIIIILLTALYDINYGGTTILIGLDEATPILFFTAFLNILLLFAIKRGLNLLVTVNLYACVGVATILVSIYYSGGFKSPVLPWLATTPIVTMLMAGRATGIFWAIFNTLTVIVLGALDKQGFSFPNNYDQSWANMLSTNCYSGLVLIIFFTALVFENGKNTALTKLAANNILLAEEKKKAALNHISQEIHNVGHTLSVVKLNLHLINMLNDDSYKVKAKETVDLVGKAIYELRNISHSLYEDNITDFNLSQSIEAELTNMSGTGAYKTKYSSTGPNANLDPKIQFVLFRIFKETINNIIKHAQASSIFVELNQIDNSLSLRVSDNGIGIDRKRLSSTGQGITNIQDRVKLLNGQLDINSNVTKGTTIHVTVPCS
jgi:signal transduction histidine kinase